jgi:hypothetical protein
MAEKQIAQPKLEKLVKERRGLEGRLSAERQGWGEKITKAADVDHLNKWAFNTVYALSKRDPARAAHDIRALQIYIDYLGLAAQGDFDEVAGEEDDTTNVVELNAVHDVLDNGGAAALDRLRRSLNDANNPKDINRGLDRFIKDWPLLEVQAHEIAETRIAQLPPEEEEAPRRRRRRAAAPQDAA